MNAFDNEPPPNFSIQQIWRTITQHSKFILVVSLLFSVIGCAVYMATASRSYVAKAEFVVKNPVYGERSNIYNHEPTGMNYFASDEEYDRFISFSQSYIVQKNVSDKFGLHSLYKIDTNSKTGIARLLKKINGNLRVARTDNSILFLSYRDKDPQRAADIANKFLAVLDSQFAAYYMDMRKAVYSAVTDKIASEDSMVRVLTDSLVVLREKYDIYDMISPARHGLISGANQYAKRPGLALGLETIQNLEAIKDEMVSDRAVTLTMARQFESSLKKGRFPLVKVITPAYPPVQLGPVSYILVAVVCFAISVFFSSIYCLYAAFTKQRNQQNMPLAKS